MFCSPKIWQEARNEHGFWNLLLTDPCRGALASGSEASTRFVESQKFNIQNSTIEKDSTFRSSAIEYIGHILELLPSFWGSLFTVQIPHRRPASKWIFHRSLYQVPSNGMSMYRAWVTSLWNGLWQERFYSSLHSFFWLLGTAKPKIAVLFLTHDYSSLFVQWYANS